MMLTLENNQKFLKGLAFLLIVFPFISWIYGAIFPIIYNYTISNVIIVIFVIIGINFIFDKTIIWHKDIIYFLPFLIIALASSIYIESASFKPGGDVSTQLVNSEFYFPKYLSYIIIYFFFLRRFFLHNFIFKLYVNTLVITFLLMLAIYILAINFDLFLDYRVTKLEYLSSNSPMQNFDHRAQVFYFLVMDKTDLTGIFNIQRFFGFSREPGFYVMFIIPGLIMAMILKMKYQVYILALATLITSSFAGFFVILILLFMSIFPIKNFKILIFVLAIFLSLVGFFRMELYELNIERLDGYVPIVDQLINKYIYNLFSLTLFGSLYILSKLAYLLIIYIFYRKIVFIDLKIVMMFFLAFVLLLNKSSELISPLFLFYLSFIDYLYLTKKKACYSETIKVEVQV